MKQISIILFALFAIMPATAFADIAPLPLECQPRCVPDCFDCHTGQPRNDLPNYCRYDCRGCYEEELQALCAPYLAQERAEQEAAIQAAEAERQAQEAAAAQQTKALETKRSCSAMPLAPHATTPLALLLMIFATLCLALPARREK